MAITFSLGLGVTKTSSSTGSSPSVPEENVLLLQNGYFILLENGNGIELEAQSVLLLETGDLILLESGDYILLE